jgi:hypothetical protein
MAFPALAADSEASLMRTRAWGETGRESSLAEGFAGLVLRETLISEGGGAGWFSAGDGIGGEILSRGLFLPGVDFAMGEE